MRVVLVIVSGDSTSDERSASLIIRFIVFRFLQGTHVTHDSASFFM